MDQYESKFIALGRYDPNSITTEEKKVHRFMEGLKPAIRRQLALLHLTTYDEAMLRAQLSKQDYELHQYDFGPRGKGKCKRLAESSPGQKKEFSKKSKSESFPRKAKTSPSISLQASSTPCQVCGKLHPGRACY